MENEGALPLWLLFANSHTDEDCIKESHSPRSSKYATVISMPIYLHNGSPLFVETIPNNSMDGHVLCCNSFS